MKKIKYGVAYSLILIMLLLCTFCSGQKEAREKVDSISAAVKNYISPCTSPCIKDSLQANSLVRLAMAWNAVNKDTAYKIAQQALSFSEKINYVPGKTRTYSIMGIIFGSQGYYEQSLTYFQSSLRLSEQTGDLDAIAVACNNIGFTYQQQHKYEEAIQIYMKGLANNIKINKKENIAEAYQKIGYIYKEWGKYDESIRNYTSYLKIATELKSSQKIAYGYVQIGEIYKNMGNYPLALQNCIKALKAAEAINDKERLGDIYNTIGHIYVHQKNYEDALTNYFSAMKISQSEGGNVKVLADAYDNIGNVYSQQGNFTDAMENLNKSLDIYKQIGYKSGIASSYGGIGSLQFNNGNYNEALKSYRASLEYFTEIQYKIGVTEQYLNLGHTYLKLKDYVESRRMLDTSLAYALEIGSKENIRDSYSALSSLDSIKGNWQEAYLHNKKYEIYQDSLFNEDNIKKTIQTHMQYEFDKKTAVAVAEQEKKDAIAEAKMERQKLITNSMASGAILIIISALLSFFLYKRRRDAEQKQKETLLSLQVSETEMKALRSQMNPHFIFNALQSIQTFLLSHKSDEANNYLLKFSKLMRAVLENSQHSEVSLKEDMLALELYMQLESIRLPHPFTYQFHIDASVDMENDTIPPLILQPFVENAIWHGLQYKSDPGHIDIYVGKKANALFATVEDNGVGRDLSKQVAQPMLLKKESLGMKLTEERLKILNELKNSKAEFKITDLFTKDNKPAGTKVELSLPAAA